MRCDEAALAARDLRAAKDSLKRRGAGEQCDGAVPRGAAAAADRRFVGSPCDSVEGGNTIDGVTTSNSEMSQQQADSNAASTEWRAEAMEAAAARATGVKKGASDRNMIIHQQHVKPTSNVYYERDFGSDDSL